MKSKVILIAISCVMLLALAYILRTKLFSPPRLPANTAGLLIRYCDTDNHANDKTIWVDDNAEITALWNTAFARWPRPADAFRWSRFGAGSSLSVIDDKGDTLSVVWYFHHRPREGKRATPFLQIYAENRYYPVGDAWSTLLSTTLARHPQVYETSITSGPGRSINSVIAAARRRGLAPLAASRQSNPLQEETIHFWLLLPQEITPQQIEDLQNEIDKKETPNTS